MKQARSQLSITSTSPRPSRSGTSPQRPLRLSSPHQPHLPYLPIDSAERSSFTAVNEDQYLDPSGYGHPAGTSSNLDHTPVRRFSSFTFSPGVKGNGDSSGLGWLDSMLEGTGGPWTGTGNNNLTTDLNFDGQNIPMHFASDQAQLLSLESPEHPLAASSSTAPGAIQNALNVTRREPQLEDVTSWANISHFISLFLQYLYPILPLVHRPTFAEHLATRRDLRDTDFRALLLSIGEQSRPPERQPLHARMVLILNKSPASSLNFPPAD